ncbi:MAG: RNA polymerase sigma factor [Planctomycetota bacterium]|jgi:RNA polymerase sigma-70 factor (ECF subfamily)
MGVTDESLLAAHLRGDRAAFRELVQRYADSLLGYLFRMTGNRDQAEDLFQETFKKVHEKAHTFRGPRLKSWLFTIATRAALDSFRRRRRARMVSLDRQNDCGPDDGASLAAAIVDPDATDPADDLVREEQAQQVRNAVDTLPPRQRATLVLAYYQQLSYPEVAQVLGCSLGTVKTQMSRALARLARQLPDSLSVTK